MLYVASQGVLRTTSRDRISTIAYRGDVAEYEEPRILVLCKAEKEDAASQARSAAKVKERVAPNPFADARFRVSGSRTDHTLSDSSPTTQRPTLCQNVRSACRNSA